MSQQGVNIDIQDGGLGQSPPGQGNIEMVVGASSAGTPYRPVTSSNPADFVAAGGYGPSIRLAAFVTKQTGNQVTWVKAPTDIAGSSTAVYSKSGNTQTSAITLSGSPNDDYYLVIRPAVGGTIGVNGCQIWISLDGGATFAYKVNLQTASTITTGSDFTTYTGLTISFGAGTLIALQDVYAVCTAPRWAATGIQSAIQAAAAIKAIEFEDIIVAGVSTPADAIAFDGYMTTLANSSKRWSALLCSARDATWGGASTETQADWITALETDWANVESEYVGVAAGYYRFIDPFTGSQLRSSLLFGASATDSAVGIEIDLGQVSLGSIKNLVLPTAQDPFANGEFFYHDESQNAGLDAARFLSAWLLVGFPGVYIKNPNLMAAPGSDFNWLQHRHVINAAAHVAYVYWTKQLSSPVRVSKKTGFILPQDRNRLQSGCQAQLNNVLVSPGKVSDATCTVSATDNILSTSTLTVMIGVIPLGYLKSVDVAITFLNPAIVVVQQAA